MSIEEKLSQMASNIEQLNKKYRLLEKLHGEISQDDSFTSKEKDAVSEQFIQFTAERNAKVEIFRQKIDIYENKVKKVEGVLEHRREVLDSALREFQVDVPEILEVFRARQEALTRELEKSKQMLDLQ